MSINQFKSQASGAQSSNSGQLDVPASANADLHPYTISSLDADRCVRCKVPLTGLLDPCEHVKRCREKQEMVENGWLPARSRCESGGRCTSHLEEHFLAYIH